MVNGLVRNGGMNHGVPKDAQSISDMCCLVKTYKVQFAPFFEAPLIPKRRVHDSHVREATSNNVWPQNVDLSEIQATSNRSRLRNQEHAKTPHAH